MYVTDMHLLLNYVYLYILYECISYMYASSIYLIQGTLADQWILPLIQGYVEVREVPVLTGQTSDVSQGLYHLEGRSRKKDTDLDLKMKVGGGEDDPGAMIEMREMASSRAEEEEEDSLKGN